MRMNSKENKNSNKIIEIEKDKRYTSVDEIRKLLQKSNKKFLQDYAFTKQVIKKESTVRVRNQSRKDVLKTKEEICQRISTSDLRRR